jgi:hypothetical protein
MSNYSQTTAFTPKDTLPTNDPNKTIFGAQFDTEFGNIASAINSKPDNLTAASFLNINVTGSGVPANGWYLPSANTLGVATNSTQRGTIGSAGNWVVNAPSSGAALQVQSLTTAQSIIAGITGAANNPRLFVTHTEASGLTDLNFTGTANFNGTLSVGGTAAIALSNARNVTINAPTSGFAFSAGGLGTNGNYVAQLTHASTDAAPLSVNIPHITLDNTNGTNGNYSGIMFRGTNNVPALVYGSMIGVQYNNHGASGADHTMFFITRNAAGTLTQGLSIGPTGQVQAFEPNFGVAAAANVATDSTGSFSATCSSDAGFTSPTVVWTRVGSMVTLNCAGTSTGTSTSTTFVFAGVIPAGIRPARNQVIGVGIKQFVDNSTNVDATMTISTAGNISFGKYAAGSSTVAAWTAAGTKTMSNWVVTYQLD